MAFSRRWGNFQPVARSVSKDEDRYDGLQLGFATYDKDDNYQLTYIEAGLRSDHIGEVISRKPRRQAANTPLPCDAELVVVTPSTANSVTA